MSSTHTLIFLSLKLAQCHIAIYLDITDPLPSLASQTLYLLWGGGNLCYPCFLIMSFLILHVYNLMCTILLIQCHTIQENKMYVAQPYFPSLIGKRVRLVSSINDLCTWKFLYMAHVHSHDRLLQSDWLLHHTDALC